MHILRLFGFNLNPYDMRKSTLFLALIAIGIVFFSCNKKDDKSDKFNFLTDNIWISDSLLVNGEDASGAGQPLEKFVGEAKFNRDGSGTFGLYSGSWYFTSNETVITITTDDLPIPLTCNIVELTASSFKITTAFTDPLLGQLAIRITFKAK